MRRLVPALTLLAACATTDDRAIIAGLIAESGRNPRADLLARVVDPSPYRIVGPRRTVTLPLSPGKVPIVRARINGVELPCIVDTGTTHLVISASAARRCGLYLPESTSITLVTPGYDAEFRIGAPESLEIGGMRLEGGIAIVPEARSGLARRLGIKSDVHATIGTAALSNFNLVFDFGQDQLVLIPHGREPFAGVMWTEVRVNGQGRLMLIDSGANGIFLEPEFALELGLVEEREARRLQRKAGRAQASLFGSVHIDQLALGSRVFRGIHAHVVEMTDQPDKGGLLGIAGLGPHRWLVDYEGRSLSLVELR